MVVIAARDWVGDKICGAKISAKAAMKEKRHRGMRGLLMRGKDFGTYGPGRSYGYITNS
jgi:hypothetical protein